MLSATYSVLISKPTYYSRLLHFHHPRTRKTSVGDIQIISIHYASAQLASYNMEYFQPEIDRFKGLTIDSEKVIPLDEKEFEERLLESLAQWKESGYRGVWVKVWSKHASLVPICIKVGFDFHHTQPGYVMLCQWLLDKEPNSLPEYANHYIGVAGFVVNDKNQLLVIQEKFKSSEHWKLPGGHADKGENIYETAVRETYEETGIKCEFDSLLAFRHQHNYRYACSDLYFICVLHPLSEEIRSCPREISKCQWMDLDEYINNPHVSDANKYFAESYKKQQANKMCIRPSHIWNYSKTVKNNIYTIQPLDKSI